MSGVPKRAITLRRQHVRTQTNNVAQQQQTDAQYMLRSGMTRETHRVAMADRIVVSEMGEMWSPKTEPARMLAMTLIMISSLPGSAWYAALVATGNRIAIVPHDVPAGARVIANVGGHSCRKSAAATCAGEHSSNANTSEENFNVDELPGCLYCASLVLSQRRMLIQLHRRKPCASAH